MRHADRSRHSWARRLAKLVLPLLASAGAAAQEGSVFEPLWVEPLPGTGPELPALLTLPPSWMSGDAAVILIAPWPSAEPWRDRLLAALVDAGAAVLEVDADTARGIAADNDRHGAAPTAEALLPDTLAALRGLWREVSAGLVVAIGHGAAGEAALRAADPALAERQFGPDGPRLAAAVALGAGRPRFAVGTPPPPHQAWPQRAQLLCALLESTLPPAEGGPRLTADCTAALLPVVPHRGRWP